MMEQREIKFRAWIELDKYMFYQNNQYLGSFLRRANTLFNPSHSGHDSYGVPPLMQYTGLKDCNGKEIYEGDVVNNWGSMGAVQWDTYEIYGNDGLKCWCAGGKAIASNINNECPYVNVIGNIYENPELLNK